MNRKYYDDDLKKSIVNLIQNGKTQVQISKKYSISLSAISFLVKLYRTVTTQDCDILLLGESSAETSLRLEDEIKKAIAFLHAGLEKRLNAVHLLRFQHKITASILNLLIKKKFPKNVSTFLTIVQYFQLYLPHNVSHCFCLRNCYFSICLLLKFLNL